MTADGKGRDSASGQVTSVGRGPGRSEGPGNITEHEKQCLIPLAVGQCHFRVTKYNRADIALNLPCYYRFSFFCSRQEN